MACHNLGNDLMPPDYQLQMAYEYDPGRKPKYPQEVGHQFRWSYFIPRLFLALDSPLPVYPLLKGEDKAGMRFGTAPLS